MPMLTKVKLTYFKPDNGTFYSSGEYTSTRETVHGIHQEVADMWARRELPGLMLGHSPFLVHVETTHPSNYPKLIGVGGRP